MKSITVYGFRFDLYKIYTSILLLFLSLIISSLLQFPSVLAQDTTNIYDLYNKGAAQDSSGNYTQAIQFYDEALAINPNYTNALTGKGVSLDKLGDHTGAITYYDKALAINPNYITALTDKGVALDRLGNHTGAITYYDQALAVNPNDINAQTYKEIAVNNLSNTTEPIKSYNENLTKNPIYINTSNIQDFNLPVYGYSNNTVESKSYSQGATDIINPIQNKDIQAPTITNKATIGDNNTITSKDASKQMIAGNNATEINKSKTLSNALFNNKSTTLSHAGINDQF